MRKTDKFLWTTDMQQDFEALKQEFQIWRVQAYPDFCSGEPFRVTTNWSKVNISGIVSQNQEREEKFIGCWGRKRNQYEWNYPSYKGELLAVIQYIKKWEHILRFRPFEYYTDSSAMKYLDSMKNQSGLFMHWYAQLAGYVLKVIHKKGKENSNADTLSMAKHLPKPTLSENEENAEYQEQEEHHIIFEEHLNEVEFLHQTSQEDLRRKKETDPVWKEVLEWVEKGGSPV